MKRCAILVCMCLCVRCGICNARQGRSNGLHCCCWNSYWWTLWQVYMLTLCDGQTYPYDSFAIWPVSALIGWRRPSLLIDVLIMQWLMPFRLGSVQDFLKFGIEKKCITSMPDRVLNKYCFTVSLFHLLHPPIGEWSMVMFVCLSVHDHISGNTYAVFTTFFACYLWPWLYAFSALMLLVGQHLACKNWVMGCWRGCLSGVRCRLAYGSADATATHCLLLQ